MAQIQSMATHPVITRWLASFLTNRKQNVKIGQCTSSLQHMKGVLPQGTIFGMEGFIIMIKDLQPPLPLYKYVDDSTTFKIISNTGSNNNRLQETVDTTNEWTKAKDMKINIGKTKEMYISFNKNLAQPNQITINGEQIERVNSTKLVGITIQDNLKWDLHIESIVKKARMKLHFLIQLKRSRVPPNELITFYKSVIRSQLEYAVPAWSTSITAEQSNTIETIQKEPYESLVRIPHTKRH
jgi:hypothetical protein